MNYKHALKKLESHRKKYSPIIAKIVDMYANLPDADYPVRFTGYDDMIVILELLDIGYLDPNSFIVKKKFEDIAALIYNGKYPLTEQGDIFYRDSRHSSRFFNFRKSPFDFHIRIVKRILDYLNFFRKNSSQK
jgi:hypothetical protein